MAVTVIMDVDARLVYGTIDEALRSVNQYVVAAWMKTDAEDILRRRTELRYQSEGDKASGEWKPLSTYTVKDRERKNFGGDHPILERTGTLKRAVISSTGNVTRAGDSVVYTWPDGINTSDEDALVAFNVAQTGSMDVSSRPIIAADQVDMIELMSSLSRNIFGGFSA